jgi:Helix-turn-helix domain
VSRRRKPTETGDGEGRARSLTLLREAVIDNAEMFTAVEFKVLLVMSEWMDFHDLGGCYPGVREIAERAGLGRRSVQRAIPALVARGWLVVMWQGGLDGGSPHDQHATYPARTTANLATGVGLTSTR